MRTRSDDIEFFIAIVDSGGISAAAKLLDVPVSTVSRSIQRLESRLATTLLVRTTRNMELTREGDVFLSAVRPGIEQLRFAEDRLSQVGKSPSGRLRVDATTPFMSNQIVPEVAAFQVAYPDIELELNTSEGISNLLENRTDLAFRVGTLENSSLHARLLGHSKLRVVASPSYWQRHGLPTSVDELLTHRLLGFVNALALNIWPLAKATKIAPSLFSNSGQTLLELCLAGNGVGLFSNFMITKHIESGHLIPVLDDCVTSPNRREPVHAVYYRNRAVSSRVKAFLDFLQPRLSL